MVNVIDRQNAAENGGMPNNYEYIPDLRDNLHFSIASVVRIFAVN